MKLVILAAVLTIFGIVSFLYLTPGEEIDLRASPMGIVAGNAFSTQNQLASSTADFVAAGTTNAGATGRTSAYKDIERQKPLPNPPEVIKAIYSTSWSAGSSKKLEYFIKLIKETELNAIVIDIKDFSGAVLYDIQNPDVIKYGAKEVRIPAINSVIKRLHDEGIYVIARQTVFQDPVLATARPDLAIQRDVMTAPAVVETNGTSTSVITATTTKRVLWLDNKGLSWIDPGAKEAWDYNIEIAKDAAERGFDEVNFDYIRFPSDGIINAMKFNYYDSQTVLKQTQITRFFAYLRERTAGIKISADLFGLVTVNNDDLGIGQNLESAAPYFDAIAPMVYPSHYAKGFIGYENPGAHPYEVVRYSMEKAVDKLTTKEKVCAEITSSATVSTTLQCETKVSYANTKLRPWLQDFDLGANYDIEEVKAQIKAVDEMVKNTLLYDGWMIWAPSNIYTRGALETTQ
ncbi:MAG: hypothetical protein HYT12_02755 [Candidatus Liptonbacteria bacterium]|nr:hypothetical protein [Candidatus Liptonbacteria bacterium]